MPIVRNYALTSTGSRSYVDTSLPEVADWGPWVEGITIHQLTVNRSGSHAWNVALQYGLDGKAWWGGSPGPVADGKTDLFGRDLTANSCTISQEFADTTQFGLRLRFLLKVSGSAGDSAVVTALAAFRLRA